MFFLLIIWDGASITTTKSLENQSGPNINVPWI